MTMDSIDTPAQLRETQMAQKERELRGPTKTEQTNWMRDRVNEQSRRGERVGTGGGGTLKRSLDDTVI